MRCAWDTGEATLGKTDRRHPERNSRDYRRELEARGQQVVEQGAIPTLGLAAGAYVLAGPTAAVAMTHAGFGYSMRYMAPLAVLGFAEQASQRAVLIKDGARWSCCRGSTPCCSTRRAP